MRLKSRWVWQFSHDFEAKERYRINSKGFRTEAKAPLSYFFRREGARLTSKRDSSTACPGASRKAKARDTPLGMTRNALARGVWGRSGMVAARPGKPGRQALESFEAQGKQAPALHAKTSLLELDEDDFRVCAEAEGRA